jgi:hypothetical protein
MTGSKLIIIIIIIIIRETNFAALELSRQCPLFLLLQVLKTQTSLNYIKGPSPYRAVNRIFQNSRIQNFK